MLLRLEGVARFFPEVDLLRNVCLQINPGDHIGLVGPNGSGKTQLLSIIAGEVTPDAGTVQRRSGLTLGKMDQRPVFDATHTVRQAALQVFAPLQATERELARLEHDLGEADPTQAGPLLERYSQLKEAFERADGYSYRARTESVIQGLGFSPADFDRPCRHLSGGQLSRLGLAGLLLRRPDILLLDEPTNHLDLSAIRWLEEYLQEWPGAFVVVSHDRVFLDRVTRRIWAIAGRDVSSWPGNYSRFQSQRQVQREQQHRRYEQHRELVRRTEDFIRRNIYGQKTKQAQSRRRMLEKLEPVEAPPAADAAQLKLDLSDIPRSSETVLQIEDLVAGYDRPLVAIPHTLTVVRGDRVGVLGDNGTGKTTLLRTLLGQVPPLGGTLAWGRNVSLGYFDQQMARLQAGPLDEIRQLAPLAPEGELRGYLARFGFRDDDVFKPLAALSGGERNRLLLARLFFERHNVLILDEPTNHLDVEAREELESALETYPGTLFVVSHDRYFLDRIVSQVLYIQSGRGVWTMGNYSDWETAETARAAQTDPDRRRATPPPSPRRERTGLSKNERQRLEREMADLENEVAAAEARLAELESSLSTPPPGAGPAVLAELADAHRQTEERLADRLARWAEVGERLDTTSPT